MAAINASASRDSNGIVHVSVVNIDPNKHIDLVLPLKSKTVSGKVSTLSKFTDINTSDRPDLLVIKTFTGYKKNVK